MSKTYATAGNEGANTALSKTASMRCYVCDTVDQWHRPVSIKDGVPQPIHGSATTQICKNCGSACHNVDASKESEIKEYYRKNYRPKPSIINLTTTTHKLQYVQKFLYDFLKERKDKSMIVGDVGAATGYLCNFFRQLGHRPTGCELTITYRRMSEHYYGIPLTEELEPKHKYDLITIYHVLEHLIEPDKKLVHYASMLAPGGHMMIATPEWFDVVEEAAGVPIVGFDHLFHENHINLFSKTSLQNLFRKCGLTVVKEDFVQYGQTYLLKKAETPMTEGWLRKEDYRDVERTMLNHKAAIELFLAGKFREAYELVPRFPDAWMNQIFGRCSKDVQKQAEIFAEADKHIGDNLKFVLSRAQWHYQQGRLNEAISEYDRVLALKPNEDTFMFLGYALAQSGRLPEAIRAFKTAQAIDPKKWSEANGWILEHVSNMPTWDERAIAEAQKAFAKQLNPPTLHLPEMDCCGRNDPSGNHAPGCNSGQGGPPLPPPNITIVKSDPPSEEHIRECESRV